MDFHDYLRFLRSSWILLVTLVFAGLGAASAYTLTQHEQWESTAKVFVGTQATASLQDLSTGASFSQQIVQSYADVVTSDLVLDPVISQLGLDTTASDLAAEVSAASTIGTSVITITASAETAQGAADIANAVSASLISAVADLTPSAAGEGATIKVTQTQTASAAETPTSPRISVNLALGGMLGLVLALVIALLRAVFDTKVRSPRDLARVADIAILGTVVEDRTARKQAIATRESRSPRLEDYRTLRTNLQFLDISRGPRSIVVTSTMPLEGKTTTTANLAVAIAETGAPILVIDADLRNPSLHKVFDLEGAVGLTDVLIGEAHLEDVLQPVGTGRLMVLPAGRLAPNPSELLQSAAFVELLATLTARFGTVLLDGAPLAPVSDSAILAAHTSGALFVASAGSTRRPQLQKALAALDQVGAKTLGFVLNHVKADRRERSAYGAYSHVTATRGEPVLPTLGAAPRMAIRETI